MHPRLLPVDRPQVHSLVAGPASDGSEPEAWSHGGSLHLARGVSHGEEGGRLTSFLLVFSCRAPSPTSTTTWPAPSQTTVWLPPACSCLRCLPTACTRSSAAAAETRSPKAMCGCVQASPLPQSSRPEAEGGGGDEEGSHRITWISCMRRYCPPSVGPTALSA